MDDQAKPGSTSDSQDRPQAPLAGGARGGLRRATYLMTGSSLLVPVAGLVSAPLLARALGVDDRGVLAAAVAPSVLMLGTATLGLPEALTYTVAKCPGFTRRGLLMSSGITIAVGLAFTGLIALALPLLAAGNADLARLILLSAVLTIPGLLVNVARGAALGQQLWVTVALERTLNAFFRVAAYVVLLWLGLLTITSVIIATAAATVVSIFVYLKLWYVTERADLSSVATSGSERSQEQNASPTMRSLTQYGGRVWLGSVASILLARVPQLLMVPLSSERNLGLYAVGVTISDVAFLGAFAVQSALFGTNSRERDSKQLLQASRLTLIAVVLGSLAMACTMPFWLGPLFGREFESALVPTCLLLLSAAISVPGLSAATALAAWGRPGVRSLWTVATLVTSTVLFVILVPVAGVLGASVSSILTSLFMSATMVSSATRVMQARRRDFFLPSRMDAATIRDEVTRVVHAVLRRRANPDGE